jgi:hypothetical protein
MLDKRVINKIILGVAFLAISYSYASAAENQPGASAAENPSATVPSQPMKPEGSSNPQMQPDTPPAGPANQPPMQPGGDTDKDKSPDKEKGY